MDFYKLSDFQLYSIINSRHLDKENKQAAVNEFNRRGLTDEEIQLLADELATKLHKEKPAATISISPNILLLLVVLFALFMLKQCVVH